ncbi:class C sortase [uncultured Corynebacterium sp.]|uniref:class C sortase n=1 Tax=uncultured Corynebacterium sp. TaxID=159447 RepID=UPI0026365879|nr:class C sortase [uncultured Corynebacterium sp.]
MLNTQVESQSEQKKRRSPFLPVLLILIGLAVLLYPVVATQWNNYQQTKVAEDYREIMEDTAEKDPDSMAKALEAAREYNREGRGGPILDAWSSRDAEGNEEYQAYLEQLSGLPAMAQIVIPSIKVNLPVMHGTSDETLSKAVGHLFGTSLPVGGPDTHAVMTGHTGLTNATLFDNLTEVKEGDAIYLAVFGEKLKYEVHDIEVVLPEETDSLKVQEGKDLLTLITCTPYGINTHRLLVHAHRVPMDPDDSAFDDAGPPIQWWMWAILAVAVLVILFLIWWLWRQKKRRKEAETAASLTSDTE